MGEVVGLFLGVVIGSLLTWFLYAVDDSSKRINCAREHNVYACEIIKTVVPIRHPTTGEGQ